MSTSRPTRPLWAFFWVFLFLMGAIGQTVAIVRKEEGDTLSEQVWWLLDWLSSLPAGSIWVALLSIGLIGGTGWAILHWLQKLMAKEEL